MITRTFSHLVLALIVFIWIVPFVALVSTSLRSETEAKTSGFWTAFTPTVLGHRFSTHDKGLTFEFIEMSGNIFDRLNGEKSGFPVSGEVQSILIKARITNPDKPGKTKLVRELVPAGEPFEIRGGSLVFQKMVISLGHFPRQRRQSLKNWMFLSIKILYLGRMLILKSFLIIKTYRMRLSHPL